MLEIRPYQECDHDVVWHLHNAALAPTGGHAGNGDWDADLHDIPNLYQKSGGLFLIALLNDEIVAMGALQLKGPGRAEVRRMRVHPDHQRKNYGQAILSELEKQAPQLGIRQLYLETTARQTAAQRFYEKNGYRETHRYPYEQFEVIHYEKELQP